MIGEEKKEKKKNKTRGTVRGRNVEPEREDDFFGLTDASGWQPKF